MSSFGYRKAQLSPQRQQELEQQRVRKQAQALLNTIGKKINSTKDPVIKDLLEKQIHPFQSQVSSIQDRLRSAPEEALGSIQYLQEQINTAFSQAEIQAKQIQLEQLKKEAGASLNDTNDMLRHILNPVVQQLIGPQLRQLQPQIKKVSELIQTDPQQAKSLSENLKRQIQEMLENSQKQLQKDSHAKAKANIALEQIKQQLEVYMAESSQVTDESTQQVRKLIDTANMYYQQSQYKQVEESCHQAAGMLKQASEKNFDETVRREVVQGLLTTLTNMGFIVQPPCLEGDNESGKIVRLLGKLPSGKTASFNVHLDGKMDFDFDGYEGKACAKELEHIDQLLEQQFSIKLGENQITWKNPDKIAKGAMQHPTGNRNINLR
jgi:hypothetical protein